MNIHFFHSVHYVRCPGSIEIFKVINFSLYHGYHHESVSPWSCLLKLEHVINNYA